MQFVQALTQGLFQFMPGTWLTTPFKNQNIFDPVANANAGMRGTAPACW